MRCTDTGTSVSHWLVRNGEFSQVHAHHLRLHFHTAEHLSVVDTDNGSNHFRDNNHVTEVRLDTAGLFAGRGLLLGLTEALDERHGLALETAGHAATGASAHQLHELIVGQVEERLELDTAEGELAELTLLAEFGNFFFVHGDCKCVFIKRLVYLKKQRKRYVCEKKHQINSARRGSTLARDCCFFHSVISNPYIHHTGSKAPQGKQIQHSSPTNASLAFDRKPTLITNERAPMLIPERIAQKRLHCGKGSKPAREHVFPQRNPEPSEIV